MGISTKHTITSAERTAVYNNNNTTKISNLFMGKILLKISYFIKRKSYVLDGFFHTPLLLPLLLRRRHAKNLLQTYKTKNNF